MPRMDGTGPMGTGPIGRGLGPCYHGIPNRNFGTQNRGTGRGMGRGMGRGQCSMRGYKNRGYGRYL